MVVSEKNVQSIAMSIMGAKASKKFSILHFDSLTAASEIYNFFN